MADILEQYSKRKYIEDSEEKERKTPFDLLTMSLNESNVYVRLKATVKTESSREVTGKLVAYDEHLNLMMTDCDEKIY